VSRRAIPGELATDYRSPAPEALAGAPRRTIALMERALAALASLTRWRYAPPWTLIFPPRQVLAPIRRTGELDSFTAPDRWALVPRLGMSDCPAH